MNTKGFDKVILLSRDEESETIKFKQIFSVGVQYVGQALQMARAFQGAVEYVTINDKKVLNFNFQKAIDIVNNHPEMAIVGTVNQTISQSTAVVKAMIDKVVELLQELLSVSLTAAETEAYEKAIKEAFTDLQQQDGDAWIFWQSTEAHKTTYQYNILFAVQNESTGSVMLALPIALTITVDIEKEKVLFITVKDEHNYDVTVQAMQVAEALK
ncbi:hypothetical protein [Clostridium sp. Marseille-Q2269]|uniref:hypothetical protein n=1 Tax=Clostridium sp. Marseille-Q2269 TaxID=2942205 RepID=UPI002073B917|nr:hypothetical protein [Clostridium sp. Marseille-Q2269]